MTSPTPNTSPSTPGKLTDKCKKLSRLSFGRAPQNILRQKISKRPLLHPAIAPKKSASAIPKIVYISSNSSFICTIKRVRNLLNEIEKLSQCVNGTSLLCPGSQDFMKISSKGRKKNKTVKSCMDEEVVMKASGKAIEKGLGLAAWWSTQDDVTVELRTGSVGAIDDIVDHDGVEQGSRVRNVSFLEVAVRLI